MRSHSSRWDGNLMPQGDPRRLTSNLTLEVTTWNADFHKDAVVWRQESVEITFEPIGQ